MCCKDLRCDKGVPSVHSLDHLYTEKTWFCNNTSPKNPFIKSEQSQHEQLKESLFIQGWIHDAFTNGQWCCFEKELLSYIIEERACLLLIMLCYCKSIKALLPKETNTPMLLEAQSSIENDKYYTFWMKKFKIVCFYDHQLLCFLSRYKPHWIEKYIFCAAYFSKHEEKWKYNEYPLFET